MGARLSIRVIDATRDMAATGLRVEVYFLGSHAAKLCSAEVDATGLVDEPLLVSDAIVPGEYEIVFHVGDFYRRRGVETPAIPFLDAVPFRFGIANPTQLCHVPVRVSPWSFAVGRKAS
jgi:5-hydroxyisourate hydrolase-like protein (transthyretin family)